ncbi:RNA-processing protein [Candidatus Woesearchaeota archaeon]|nr:RNA-processing protein [Candidatus Woesearchaeota archaeon]
MQPDMDYFYDLKIPKERVAVLIGKDGEIKKQIEKETHARIVIDSKEGDVRVIGREPVGLLSAREIIKAIGRGFNPEFAMLLLKQDYCLEIINISDTAGKSKKKLMRIRGRIIGEDGKSRKTIEDLTETSISVYGKTVSIIGKHLNADLARKAVESLISGAKHSAVYRRLEKKSKELKISALDQDVFKETNDQNG